MYKVIEKKECKNCQLSQSPFPVGWDQNFCRWGKNKKGKKIIKTKSKSGMKNCRLIGKEINE